MSRSVAIAAGVVVLLLILAGIAHVRPVVNDDAYVYYTYARSFSEARPFAYDARGIRSEGFTSLLYLLLLVPFEIAGVNLTFVATLLNIAALVLCVAIMTWLLWRCRLLSPSLLALFPGLALLLLLHDSNIMGLIEKGLETMLGPLMLLVTTAALSIALDPASEPRTRHRAVSGFFISLFLNYITRPENLLVAALAGGVPLLLTRRTRSATIRRALIFALAFAGYHALKLVVFGDLLATGFYRKVSVSGSGDLYVVQALLEYAGPLLILLLIVLFSHLVRPGRTLLRRQQVWLWMPLALSAGIFMFFTQTTPLVGEHQRFLVSPIVFLYLLLTALALYQCSALLSRLNQRWRQAASTGGLLLLGAGTAVFLLPALATPDALNLYARIARQTEQHVYLRLGSYLREHIPDYEQVTLVWGDAGAIPYAFGGRFIDWNGLTEPAIAHLFSLPEGPEKTQRFIDYVLANDPDIVILAFGEADSEGRWQARANPHSPFRQPTPTAVFQALADDGIGYLCTISDPGIYDLHVGVNVRSPQFADIQTALSAFCAGDGFVLENGLTILSDDGAVHFPVIPPSAGTSE